MVQAMRPGSVLVDLAADQGGNCALTEPGKEIVKFGVTIIGPLNIASTVPFHASQMYARTVTNYLLHLVKDGQMQPDWNDELTRAPLVTREEQIVHEVAKTTVAAGGQSS
jgi:NAD(P) transhydrogenase subunit alpha